VEPVGALKSVEVCADDGYLASELCTKRPQSVPVASHFDRQTPYHLTVHMDAAGRSVDASCERVVNMRHAAWFVLPPTLEFYYRAHHSDYRPQPAVVAARRVAACWSSLIQVRQKVCTYLWRWMVARGG
jgi:penicillin-binding protein 1C